jgi:hypothetical protein
MNDLLEKVLVLQKEEKHSEAGDIIYDTIDDTMLAGDYSSVNDFLKQVDVNQLETSLLLCILVITMPWISKLDYRITFFNKVREIFVGRHQQDKADRLVKGIKK